MLSLRNSGIEKIVLLNSHGGNEFQPLLRELADEGITVFLIDWFRVLNDIYHTIFEHREDHAGEMETSFALACFPHLVRHNPDGTLAADDGATRTTMFEVVNNGWVSVTRPWHLLTTNTGSGPRDDDAHAPAFTHSGVTARDHRFQSLHRAGQAAPGCRTRRNTRDRCASRRAVADRPRSSGPSDQ